jgi:cytochrome c biogenesis protein CcmG/thiol:disulfide interchange protein DsbE
MEEREVPTAEKRSRNTIRLIVFIIVAVAIVFFLHRYVSFINLSRRTLVVVGDPAPVFTFPGLDGKVVSLTDYKGKVVFLNIWATWCLPCREEMPSMEKLYQQLKGEDFEILAISIDATGAKAVGPFMKEYGLSFPALLDTGGTIQDLYGTTGIPESYVIGKEGFVEEIVIGPKDWSTPEVVRFFRELIQRPKAG